LDIDLQGIKEVLRQDVRSKKRDQSKTSESYLKEMMEGKSENYYREKLTDLQFVVIYEEFGVQSSQQKRENDPRNDAIPVAPSEEIKKFMKGKKSISELVDKSKNENNIEKIETIKRNILSLVGLKHGNQEKKILNYQQNIDSPIIKFMCLLDCRIKKKKYDDVDEIINYFSNINNNQGWDIPGANPNPIKSFHDWFCALDNCVDGLRNLIPSK